MAVYNPSFPTSLVQKHVSELVAANKVPVLGIFLGKDAVRWSWDDMINKKLGFYTELEAVVLLKEPVYLKVGDYVPIQQPIFYFLKKFVVILFVYNLETVLKNML